MQSVNDELFEVVLGINLTNAAQNAFNELNFKANFVHKLNESVNLHISFNGTPESNLISNLSIPTTQAATLPLEYISEPSTLKSCLIETANNKCKMQVQINSDLKPKTESTVNLHETQSSEQFMDANCKIPDSEHSQASEIMGQSLFGLYKPPSDYILENPQLNPILVVDGPTSSEIFGVIVKSVSSQEVQEPPPRYENSQSYPVMTVAGPGSGEIFMARYNAVSSEHDQPSSIMYSAQKSDCITYESRSKSENSQLSSDKPHHVLVLSGPGSGEIFYARYNALNTEHPKPDPAMHIAKTSSVTVSESKSTPVDVHSSPVVVLSGPGSGEIFLARTNSINSEHFQPYSVNPTVETLNGIVSESKITSENVQPLSIILAADSADEEIFETIPNLVVLEDTKIIRSSGFSQILTEKQINLPMNTIFAAIKNLDSLTENSEIQANIKLILKSDSDIPVERQSRTESEGIWALTNLYFDWLRSFISR